MKLNKGTKEDDIETRHSVVTIIIIIKGQSSSFQIHALHLIGIRLQ